MLRVPSSPGPRGRIDTSAILARVDLAGLITADRGQPDGSRKWLCPFHDDHHPSLGITPDGKHFKCWACDTKGSALDWVMRREGLSFSEAVRRLGPNGPAPPRGPTRPPGAFPAPHAGSSSLAHESPATAKPGALPSKPSRLDRDQANQMLAFAQRTIWNLDGRPFLDELIRTRGLEPETIRSAGVGWTPPWPIPGREGRTWRVGGYVIPWFDHGRLVRLKVRQPPGKQIKYVEVFTDPDCPPVLYPDPALIRPGRPVILAEGEFDALTLGEALGDRAVAVSPGSASMARPDPAILAALIDGGASAWFIGYDADEAGDRAAELWSRFPRANRLRPPEGAKDWSELHMSGFNRIRYHCLAALGWLPPSWDELGSWRWGPGLVSEDDPVDEDYDRAERRAIQDEDEDESSEDQP